MDALWTFLFASFLDYLRKATTVVYSWDNLRILNPFLNASTEKKLQMDRHLLFYCYVPIIKDSLFSIITNVLLLPLTSFHANFKRSPS